MKIFRIISPVLLFEVISIATSFVVSLMFISEYGAIYYDPNDVTSVQTVYGKLYEGLAKYSVIITLAAALIALPLLIKMRKKDELRRDYRIIPSSIPKWSFVISALVGALLCYGLNMLIELSQIAQTYTGVQEALELIYAGGLPLRIIAVGIIVPAIEELVFRGW